MIYIAMGVVIAWFFKGGEFPQPQAHMVVTERVTELLVIISLMGVGLKIDQPLSFRGWLSTWKLLSFTMIAGIAMLAFLSWWILGFSPEAAILLGAVLAPTDPVLASEVQSLPPLTNEKSEVRFALTSEAGFNDGLAFPFTGLALALAAARPGYAGWFYEWLWHDLFYKVGVGILSGAIIGYLLARFIFSAKAGQNAVTAGEGLVAIAATLTSYSLTEMIRGYGFLESEVSDRYTIWHMQPIMRNSTKWICFGQPSVSWWSYPFSCTGSPPSRPWIRSKCPRVIRFDPDFGYPENTSPQKLRLPSVLTIQFSITEVRNRARNWQTIQNQKDRKEAKMNADPLNLNYRRWGSGKPLIVVHGLFGSAVNWQSIGLRLSQDWTVFALDLRNHGDSPSSADFSYDALVQDLQGFMEQQHIEKAILLGHSLGGKIVMAFADRFPEKAERLIILDIAPRPYPGGHREILKAMIDLDLSRMKSRKEALDALAGSIPALATRQFLLKNLVRGADGRYRWKINLAAIYPHLDELSQGPQLKNQYPNFALFISGSESEYITEEDTGLIRRYYPNARIVIIDGAGHWLHADAQEQTVEAITGFLRSTS